MTVQSVEPDTEMFCHIEVIWYVHASGCLCATHVTGNLYCNQLLDSYSFLIEKLDWYISLDVVSNPWCFKWQSLTGEDAKFAVYTYSRHTYITGHNVKMFERYFIENGKKPMKSIVVRSVDVSLKSCFSQTHQRQLTGIIKVILMEVTALYFL